ncbi:hypothetical protein QA601_14485 [Chitinispirillales bacterium ANBcel5]|nr:hypothetical protein [Chitinispirillales bacterium ANBcel5]
MVDTIYVRSIDSVNGNIYKERESGERGRNAGILPVKGALNGAGWY